jgi:hypothetical protein
VLMNDEDAIFDDEVDESPKNLWSQSFPLSRTVLVNLPP